MPSCQWPGCHAEAEVNHYQAWDDVHIRSCQLHSVEYELQMVHHSHPQVTPCWLCDDLRPVLTAFAARLAEPNHP